MSASTRKAVLFAILAGALGLVIVDYSREEHPTRFANRPASDVPPVDGKVDGSSQPGAAKGMNVLALPERPLLGELRSELFSSHSWQPPAPKISAAPAAPVAPSAPPMPYRYAGKLVQGGEYSVLLSKGDAVFPIREGDTLEGAYRVEAIGETQVTLVYLPLGRKENIPVVSSLPAMGAVSGASPAAAQGTSQAVPAIAAAHRSTPSAGGAFPGATHKTETGPARLLWEGPQQVKLGASFDVALRVTSIQPLHAAPMQLRFDSAFLEFVAAKPGKFFGSVGRNFIYRANPDGSIFVGATNRNPATAADAELLILTFKSVKPAPAAQLSVASLNLQGTAGRPIAFGRLVAFKTVISP